MIEQTWLLWLVGTACVSALVVLRLAFVVRIADASRVDAAWVHTVVPLRPHKRTA